MEEKIEEKNLTPEPVTEKKSARKKSAARKRRDINLVIVESPTKAKTIGNFLGNKFVVTSSFGHVRDLPRSRMGIDIEHDFTPSYTIPAKSRPVIKELKELLKRAKMVYLATDADREGEAISWHLEQALKLTPEETKRIVFHEITKKAIAEALEHPRELNNDLVNAQQARRVLDRLVGYELSPFLWHKVASGLSAGRVQSATVRLIVEREREIETFKPEEYWTIEGQFKKPNGTLVFDAKLTKIGEKQLEKFDLKQAQVQKIEQELSGAKFVVQNIEQKKTSRTPLAPFTTSTLQQEANKRLGFSSKQTMFIAQQLYEGVNLGELGHTGLITYMRTDSVNLSESFLADAKNYLTEKMGQEYAAPAPRIFKTKSKLAQEAHEAIRPVAAALEPSSIQNFLEPEQFKLYSLIWSRAVASQMADVIFSNTAIDLAAKSYIFHATGQMIVFPGFHKIYDTDSKETRLPELALGEPVNQEKIENKQHFTEPPPRYNDASLVKILEENGIGRPSTYAPTISTIIDRKYIERNTDRRFKPTEIGIIVNDLLVANFPQIVDYQFTAKMEDEFDEIAAGKPWVPIIREFYTPFKLLLQEKEKEIDKKKIIDEKTDEICDKCGAPIIIKFGRFGKFLACSKFPECKNTKSLDKAVDRPVGVKCPFDDGDILERRSRRGKMFFSCGNWPKCKFALWQRPLNQKCPKCGSLLYELKKSIKCTNKECDYNLPKTE